VLASFLTGVAAGYAIAIPVGAIAVLIVEIGIRRGFRTAAAAGAGAASADGLYASLAAIGGAAIAGILEPFARPLKIVAIGALLGIGLRGLVLQLRVPRSATGSPGIPGRARGTYARFLALTLLNPATVIYFAALILAVPNLGRGPAERAAFVAGAFLSSLSWQTTLAAVGAVAHHRLPPRFQTAISLFGNLVICGFAVLLARSL
jgi:threonine/homoserine/homoserine lactone efflux protein